MDFVKSQFEAALASKRPLNKQGLTSLIESVDRSQYAQLYRRLFHRLNDHLLHLARHNQPIEAFQVSRQLSLSLHEQYINHFSSLDSSPIKQLSQILKSLQQQQSLSQSELNQWKRSQQGLTSDDLILHCLFNNAPQLALTNDNTLFLGDLFRVALHTCVQNLADRDNKTSLKILLSLGLAPLDIIQRVMSSTVYHHLRTFCAQYLNEFSAAFYLSEQESNTLTFINQLKQDYSNESVLDVIESRKPAMEFWNKIFHATPFITTFTCRDIVPNIKQSNANARKAAYVQMTFDWINTIMEKTDREDQCWLLLTEGRHLTSESPLFSSHGKQRNSFEYEGSLIFH